MSDALRFVSLAKLLQIFGPYKGRQDRLQPAAASGSMEDNADRAAVVGRAHANYLPLRSLSWFVIARGQMAGWLA